MKKNLFKNSYLRSSFAWISIFYFIWTQTSVDAQIPRVNVDSQILDTSSLQLPDVIALNISQNNITYITPTYFTNSGIVKLYLSENLNYDFPTRAFIHSTRLARFECVNCSITKIDRDTLTELPELTHMDLSRNRLEYVHSEAFAKNTKMYFLSLKHNRITVMNEKGFLTGLRSLCYLYLSGNSFTFTNGPLFAPSEAFRVLDCNNCDIKEPCPNVIEVYPNLMKLELRNNSVEKIDCLKENNIYWLDLSGNDIKDLQVEGTKLKSFACNNCSYTRLGLDTFKFAPILESLELSSNKINTIDVDTFKRNSNLKKIKLDNNVVTKLPIEAINGLGSLATLCIENNPLSPNNANYRFLTSYRSRQLNFGCPKDGFNKFPKILAAGSKSLTKRIGPMRARSAPSPGNLFKHDIEYIEPDLFADQPDLKVLNMSHNTPFHFQEKQPFLSHVGIEEIDVSACSIDTIYPETFSELPALLKVDLSQNKITSLPENAFRYTKIQDLILDFNDFTYLHSRAVDKASNLTRLSMNGNENFDFEEDRVFLYHDRIQQFHCNRCGVTTIYHDTLSRMTNLRELILSDNQISEIEADSFAANIKLHYLNLDGNLLTTFDAALIRPLTVLRFFCMDGNENFEPVADDRSYDLRELYVERDFRSPRCVGKLKIEEILPERPQEVQREQEEQTEANTEVSKLMLDKLQADEDDLDDYDEEMDISSEIPPPEETPVVVSKPTIKLGGMGGSGATGIHKNLELLGLVIISLSLIIW